MSVLGDCVKRFMKCVETSEDRLVPVPITSCGGHGFVSADVSYLLFHWQQPRLAEFILKLPKPQIKKKISRAFFKKNDSVSENCLF